MTTLAPPTNQAAGNSPMQQAANPPPVDRRPVLPEEPAPHAVTLYFGGSYPMFAPAGTLHGFVAMVEEAVLRALLGEKYQPDMHMDVRAIKHPSLDFGKWKGELSSMAKKMLPRLPPGHYLVTNEEKMQVVADALLPRVNGVGGPR